MGMFYDSRQVGLCNVGTRIENIHDALSKMLLAASIRTFS
jgi:hypothetical protein